MELRLCGARMIESYFENVLLKVVELGVADNNKVNKLQDEKLREKSIMSNTKF